MSISVCIPPRHMKYGKGKEMTGIKNQHIMIVTGMVLVILIAGCMSEVRNRGNVVAQPLRGEHVTVERLIEDFAKYDVYYSGTKPSKAVSILFCPKDGDTMITPDRWWEKVKDQAALKNIVSWMNTETYHLPWPSVLFVVGPDSRLFGYIYSFNFQIRTRVASETNLIVYAPVN